MECNAEITLCFLFSLEKIIYPILCLCHVLSNFKLGPKELIMITLNKQRNNYFSNSNILSKTKSSLDYKKVVINR